MITGVITRDIVLGDPGAGHRLPAGSRCQLLPIDQPFGLRWIAKPLATGPQWQNDYALRMVREGHDIALTDADVAVQWESVRLRLVNAATAYDGKEHDAADRNPRRRHYNPHALPQYLARVDEIVADMQRGAAPREAILQGFSGRLGDAFLKALGLPASDKAERCRYAGLIYRPVTQPPTTEEMR
ncbi:MAG: hypothetical protein EHM35_00700 [Planctomycetaceae bacterium]|nr:MAG: hypothetical protein EHM35_00700 [Planctomycetaceae bacterium]